MRGCFHWRLLPQTDGFSLLAAMDYTLAGAAVTCSVLKIKGQSTPKKPVFQPHVIPDCGQEKATCWQLKNVQCVKFSSIVLFLIHRCEHTISISSYYFTCLINAAHWCDIGGFHPTRDQERDDECDLLLSHTGQNSVLGNSVCNLC